ncbi:MULTISPECIES: hypothetical protein [Pseudomonas]|uniref:hypothetical protein n=1 Tax=Pseudomonas TaxID=286 RepID=UPI0018E8CF77|nr:MULTISPECIES: hypothetical protein [Pseudomonas]MBJ2214122.1 hypothetical protein [Pseudomonas carnis]MBP5947990.1 hypothetical protein [Pseudomonas sp. P9(2020)]
MLPSHLSRFMSVCLNGDYKDAKVREQIKTQCIPYLAQHRREVLAGSFTGRHSRPAGYIARVSEKASLIRRTLRHAHQQLMTGTSTSNVISFSEAAKRHRQNLSCRLV